MAEPSTKTGWQTADGPESPARTFASMVKLSHTIFGLPFTLASALVAHRFAVEAGGPGLTWGRLALIVLAFTGARTAAMGFNRIVDRDVDAKNPRTAQRELPAGKISLRAAWALTALSVAVFVAAAAGLGRWPLLLSLPCVGVIFGYSSFKRFSSASHLVLGVALALGPGGAWIAVTDSFHGWPVPLMLMAAVASWVAGFDVLYSLQDEAFDRETGLHSIPARFGTRGAVVISAALHVVTAGALLGFHWLGVLGGLHLVGVTVIAALLAYEHWLVGPGRLDKIDKAFFDLNGYVSLVYLGCVVADMLVRGWPST